MIGLKYNEVVIVLGKRLAKARKAKQFTQDYVANIIGTTYQTISNYERDERDPDTQTLAKLASLYEVSLDWLLNGHSPNTTQPDFEAPFREKTLADAVVRIVNMQVEFNMSKEWMFEMIEKATAKYGKPIGKGGMAAHFERDDKE